MKISELVVGEKYKTKGYSFNVTLVSLTRYRKVGMYSGFKVDPKGLYVEVSYMSGRVEKVSPTILESTWTEFLVEEERRADFETERANRATAKLILKQDLCDALSVAMGYKVYDWNFDTATLEHLIKVVKESTLVCAE